MTQAALGSILVVEDEAPIADFIATELRFEGYEVTVAHDGMQGLTIARQLVPDLIILDVQLPGLDGINLCKRLRQSSDVPILMLTARTDIRDKVEGLDAGANDYLPKPFNLDELLARVRAQLRSRKPLPKTQHVLGDLSLDEVTREVTRGQREISLTPKEFDLLLYLLKHPKQVLTRNQLLENVWGYDFGGDDNVLEVYIRYLRNKIEAPSDSKLIYTVRGVGYQLKES
jgi:DNA-binding response OmpR family regulator